MKVLVLLCVAAVGYGMPSVGLVGPSGVIGPSGIVGPSGPVQFSQPAWAFLGHAAHEHIAALNRVRTPAVPTHVPVPVATPVQYVNPAVFQPAPTVPVQYGVDAAGCVVGPSGKVCPSGNIQFT